MELRQLNIMTEPVINMEETLALCNNNESLANELIAMLKADLPRQKQILIYAFERDDEQTMRDIVHQILGTCSYISLPQIKKNALALQDAIRSQKGDLVQLRNQLIDAMDAVIVHP